MDAAFLPRLPLALEPPLPFGALLLAGLLGYELARRFLALPRISGYVLAGVALGP